MRFIKEVQQLGFSLAEARDLLNLQANIRINSAEVRSAALETKKKVDENCEAER